MEMQCFVSRRAHWVVDQHARIADRNGARTASSSWWSPTLAGRVIRRTGTASE